MATIKFIIRSGRKNKEGQSSIMLQYGHRGKTILLSTGEKIEPELWDKENGKFRRSRKHTDLSTKEEILLRKRDEIEQIVRQLKLENADPTTECIKERLESSRQKAEDVGSSAPRGLIEAFEEWIRGQQSIRTASTIQVYRSCLMHLRNFQSKKRQLLSFETMDMRFYDRFTSYLIEDLGLKNNTVGKQIKTLKTFLNHAVDRDIQVNQAYRKFKVLREESDIIYLTENELVQLYNLDLSKNTKLAHVRDVFCFQCYTGLRFSDVERLKPEHIVDGKIRIRAQKTMGSLSVPILPQAQTILDRYIGKHPNCLPVISNQKTNQYLKELGKLAGLDTPVVTESSSGSKRTESTFAKWELLTTHTGRRTFVTLNLEKGIRPEVLMKITGHKDMKSFMRYVSITEKVAEEQLREAWG